MKKFAAQIREFLFNEEIDINERLSVFFIYVGIVAAVLGTLVSLFSHAPIIGTIGCAIIAVGAPLVASFTNYTGKRHLFGRIIAISIIVMIPFIWIYSGGSSGGTTIWFVYELFYITLFASKKKELILYIVPAMLLQAACFVLEARFPWLVQPLATRADCYVSLIGDAVVVSAEILLTVIIQKELYQHERSINSESQDFTKNFVTSIANTIDTKDNYTGGHSRRVAECASDIARRMGMSEEEIENVYSVALLHDIGKIGVPDRVLNKPGRLSDEEFELIRRHPVFGAEIVRNISMIPNVLDGVLYHHERYDGAGYPEGLKGEQIPRIARIIAVADSYDAMSTNRIYRKFIRRDQIVSTFIKCRGTQFDPYITDVFVQMLMEGYTTTSAVELGIEDIERNLTVSTGSMIRSIAESDRKQGAVTGAMNVDGEEFAQIYAYLRNLGHRYGDEVLLLSITLSDEAECLKDEERLMEEMADLNHAITEGVRAVDMCTRYTTTSYLVMLLNAPAGSVEQIMDRVTANYRRLRSSGTVSLKHAIVHGEEALKTMNIQPMLHEGE